MNTDVADLLHESIDRLADGARVPAGLADRALRRNRQRQMTLGTAVAGSTAVLAAAAVFVAMAVTGGALHRGKGNPAALTTAYVLSRTERALAAAERRGLIQEVRAAVRGFQYTVAPGPARPTSRAVFWSYRGQFREQGLTADGSPLFDADAVYTPAGQRRIAQGTNVDYATKTWWRVTVRQRVGPAPSMRGCGGAYVPAPDSVQTSSPTWIRRALSCPHYRVAGRLWIDGIHTIKITGLGPASIQTFWVDPATYLPVRVRVAWPARHGMPYTREVGDFRWLTPTRAHLAMLEVPVPPGFRRIPDPSQEVVGFGTPHRARIPSLPQIALAERGAVVGVASR